MLQSDASPPPAIVLAGGRGTRIAALYPDLPKPLIPIARRPFLDYVLSFLEQQGIAEIHISAGYKGELVESFVRERKSLAMVHVHREPYALGTGGAIEFVLSQADLHSPFLVVNGDSIIRFDWRALSTEVEQRADGVIAAVQVDDVKRYGSLALRADRSIEGFLEKNDVEGAGLINGGVYLFGRHLFSGVAPEIGVSLEQDCFPRWVEEGRRLVAVRSRGPFVDIGTPESLAGPVEDIVAAIFSNREKV